MFPLLTARKVNFITENLFKLLFSKKNRKWGYKREEWHGEVMVLTKLPLKV